MRRAEAGFSLVEVLVALAVLGLALLALLRLGAANAATAFQLERATFGDIVAENALVEALVADPPPAYGEERLSVDNLGERWSVARTASRAGEDGVMMLRVDVRGEDGALAASLTGMRSAE